MSDLGLLLMCVGLCGDRGGMGSALISSGGMQELFVIVGRVTEVLPLLVS